MIKAKMTHPGHPFMSNGDVCECVKDLELIRDALTNQKRRLNMARSRISQLTNEAEDRPYCNGANASAHPMYKAMRSLHEG